MDHIHTEDAQAYYMDQLCTIALCGALAGVGIMMWAQELLQYILAPQFHLLVLLGSVLVLVLVILRAVALWQAVGQARGQQHSHGHDGHDHHDHEHHHDHGQGHDHGHGHHHDHHEHHHDHGHDHDHGHAHASTEKQAPSPAPAAGHAHHDHEHGWSPWRYMVLLLPIFLYLAGLPNKGFSPEGLAARIGPVDLDDPGTVEMAFPDQGVIPLEFAELRQAAFVPAQRQFWEGKMGRLLGQYLPQDDTTCSLVRVKMVCCAADATPINVIVISREKMADFKPLQWIQVEGQIQFRKRKDRDEYVPVLQIQGRDKMTPADPPKNPYI